MRVGNLTRVQCLVATFIAVVVLATVIHKVVEASSTGSGREGFFPSNWDKCAGNPCEARITGCIKTDSTKITLCCLDSDGDKVHHRRYPLCLMVLGIQRSYGLTTEAENIHP